MSYTDVDICNIALGRVGVDQTIASLSERSKEARLCQRFYPLARDLTLEAAPWPFAVRVAALALLPDADLLPGWSYHYALPTDALSVLEVVPAGSVTEAVGYYTDCCGPWMPYRRDRQSFRRGLAPDGLSTVLMSTVDDAYGVYVARVTDTAIFSPMMVSLVADRLAMELATPLTTDPRWFQYAQQRFSAAFIDTASRAYEQEADTSVQDPPSIRARG